MTIDPGTKAVLDALPEGDGIETMTATEARALYAAMPRPAELVPVDRVENRDADGVPVRIYWPSGATGPTPLVVFYHGGGWVLGDLDTHDDTCRRLTNIVGCTTVSVDYRLAPEHRFPAAADDALTTLRWAAKHADSLGCDPSRLAVAGDSAGGNLAAVTAQRARDENGPVLAYQLLVYPVTDADFSRQSYADNGKGYMLTLAGMQWFWDHYCPDAEARRDPKVSPLRATSLAGLPPAIVITAEFDPLRDEGEAYADALMAAGVATTARRVDGHIHGFMGLSGVLDSCATETDAVFGMFRQAFG
jgi:acetyl esterase